MPMSYRSMREAIEHGRGIERPFNCPVHGDDHASASVNVEKGVWFCHACHASGKTQEGKHDLTYVRMMVDEEIPALSPMAIQYTNAINGYGMYWAARYGKEVATRFQTGVDPVTGMPTVPIHDALGTTVHGFLKRRIDNEEGPKYLYPGGVPVSRLLFGHHMVPANPEVLVLVEGASDAMSLHRWPVPRSAAVVAVYGSGVHASQAELVRELHPHRAICAMDADNAGKLGSQRSLDLLASYGVAGAVYPWSRMGVNDPGELEEDPWPELMMAK
jgi:DNA primase